MAVATGVADVVVCYRAFNERSGHAVRPGATAVGGATPTPPASTTVLVPARAVARRPRRWR